MANILSCENVQGAVIDALVEVANTEEGKELLKRAMDIPTLKSCAGKTIKDESVTLCSENTKVSRASLTSTRNASSKSGYDYKIEIKNQGADNSTVTADISSLVNKIYEDLIKADKHLTGVFAKSTLTPQGTLHTATIDFTIKNGVGETNTLTADLMPLMNTIQPTITKMVKERIIADLADSLTDDVVNELLTTGNGAIQDALAQMIADTQLQGSDALNTAITNAVNSEINRLKPTLVTKKNRLVANDGSTVIGYTVA